MLDSNVPGGGTNIRDAGVLHEIARKSDLAETGKLEVRPTVIKVMIMAAKSPKFFTTLKSVHSARH